LRRNESFAPVGGFFAGLILLALVATAILVGYGTEEESTGNRLFWAEWALPGSGEQASPAVEREYLKAVLRSQKDRGCGFLLRPRLDFR